MLILYRKALLSIVRSILINRHHLRLMDGINIVKKVTIPGLRLKISMWNKEKKDIKGKGKE
jgi:hypothetical protein